MIATNWREMGHAVMLNAVVFHLPIRTSGRFPVQSAWRSLRRLGADLGLPFQQPFRYLSAMFTHVGAAAPGNPTAIDTPGFGRRAIVA